MGRFGNFLYGADTYGERVRGDIPLELINTGYWQDPQGRIYARFYLTVGIGSLDSRYPVGSQVVVVRGSSWYPEIPGKYGDPPDPSTGWDGMDNVLLSAEVIEVNGQKILSANSKTITDRDISPVPINSVMYVRVFVRESAGQDEDGNPIVLPWEIRGSVATVMAGYYGGIESSLAALPPTIYSGGDTFAQIDRDSVTAYFMGTLGFLADTIFTDGSLMIDVPSRLHPAVVLPMLRSLGLTKEEEAAFTDPLLSSRLKSLLFAYRRIQASRGTPAAIGELVRVLSGYEVDVLPRVENLLATLGDSSPGGVLITPEGKAWACGYEVSGDYATACTLDPIGDIPAWGDPWVTWMSGEREEDGYDDVWLEDWDQLGLAVTASLPTTRAIDDDDDMFAEDYVQHVDWVHAFTFDQKNTASIGTKTVDGVVRTDYCEPIEEFSWFRLRFRVYAPDGVEVAPHLHFVLKDGSVVDVDSTQESVAGNSWITVTTNSIFSPKDTQFIGWRIDLESSSGTAFIGAIELRDVTLVSESAVRGVAFDSADDDFDSVEVMFDQRNISGDETLWLLPYRNPRSVVVSVHTPWVDLPDNPDDRKFLMDSDAPGSFDSTSIPMNGTSLDPLASVVATDALIVRRIERLLHDYVPHSVTARIIASWDEEYILRYPDRRVDEPTAAPRGNKSMLAELDQAVLQIA